MCISIRKLLLVLLWLVLAIANGQAAAEGIRVAVASNFTAAMKSLAQRFEANTGHKVTLVFGSTGKHYAQIKNGAPFDAFFSADVRRPGLLEAEGIALPGTRFTYAIGKLVLWSPKADTVDVDGQVLETGTFRHLAIANPKLAPYGKAAQEVLQARGLWESLEALTVRGENIGQTFQFVQSGNAELGFVAYSQIKQPGKPCLGSWWLVPQELYTPIEQQGVLLREGGVARAFLSYVKGDESQALIRELGYGLPRYK